MADDKQTEILKNTKISVLSERSRDIFRAIVDSYLDDGSPVGSRTVSRRLDVPLSPASIRNVMSDLEVAGLLYAPHTSAGRLPTELGLRLFVDGLLEIGELTKEERASIDAICRERGRAFEDVLTDVSDVLSGLSRCAGMVMVPKHEEPLKQIEFVSIGNNRALMITVTEAGHVENAIVELPADISVTNLTEATNFLNARLKGRTLDQARQDIIEEVQSKRARLDDLTASLISDGLAQWGGDGKSTLIVSGRSNLLDDVNALEDLERIRQLFDDLESQEKVSSLLNAAQGAEGVRIFIGSENSLFSMSGSSVIVAPYRDSQQKIIGALGVIGPTHVNYARIIPMVDYTARVMSRVLG